VYKYEVCASSPSRKGGVGGEGELTSTLLTSIKIGPQDGILEWNFYSRCALLGTLFIYFCIFLSTVLIQYSSLVMG
jgi:hypothetical protein